MRSPGFILSVPEDAYILELRDNLKDFLPRAKTREKEFNCQKSPSHRWRSSNKGEHSLNASHMLYR